MKVYININNEKGKPVGKKLVEAKYVGRSQGNYKVRLQDGTIVIRKPEQVEDAES